MLPGLVTLTKAMFKASIHEDYWAEFCEKIKERTSGKMAGEYDVITAEAAVLLGMISENDLFTKVTEVRVASSLARSSPENPSSQAARTPSSMATSPTARTPRHEVALTSSGRASNPGITRSLPLASLQRWMQNSGITIRHSQRMHGITVVIAAVALMPALEHWGWLVDAPATNFLPALPRHLPALLHSCCCHLSAEALLHLSSLASTVAQCWGDSWEALLRLCRPASTTSHVLRSPAGTVKPRGSMVDIAGQLAMSATSPTVLAAVVCFMAAAATAFLVMRPEGARQVGYMSDSRRNPKAAVMRTRAWTATLGATATIGAWWQSMYICLRIANHLVALICAAVLWIMSPPLHAGRWMVITVRRCLVSDGARQYTRRAADICKAALSVIGPLLYGFLRILIILLLEAVKEMIRVVQELSLEERRTHEETMISRALPQQTSTRLGQQDTTEAAALAPSQESVQKFWPESGVPASGLSQETHSGQVDEGSLLVRDNEMYDGRGGNSATLSESLMFPKSGKLDGLNLRCNNPIFNEGAAFVSDQGLLIVHADTVSANAHMPIDDEYWLKAATVHRNGDTEELHNGKRKCIVTYQADVNPDHFVKRSPQVFTENVAREFVDLVGQPAAHFQRALTAHCGELLSFPRHQQLPVSFSPPRVTLPATLQSQQHPPLQQQQHLQAHAGPSLQRTYSQQLPSKPPVAVHPQQQPQLTAIIAAAHVPRVPVKNVFGWACPASAQQQQLHRVPTPPEPMEHTHLEQELLQREAAVTNDAVHQQLVLLGATQQPSLLDPCAHPTPSTVLLEHARQPHPTTPGTAEKDVDLDAGPYHFACRVHGDQAGAERHQASHHATREFRVVGGVLWRLAAGRYQLVLCGDSPLREVVFYRRPTTPSQLITLDERSRKPFWESEKPT
ncbi:hypothetical protein CYMTET_29322 [Cymbomonas tetramitiformis]|uniref:Uncharacterized protein n=1 Tax=Cymbomonas tetramitiformis TaxID=36881 RepID=A0AAE0FL13_9CHLO|nr:hypothetical protein CYMTET_29322 [Cymbomonas tetramitiformis]